MTVSRSWDDATPMEILEARVQSAEEGLEHLKDCVMQALMLCDPVAGAPVSPWVILDEEWSK